MSLMPDCTCEKKFGYVFGDYSTACPRHSSVAKWLEQKSELRAAELAALRQQALSRPVHGGYPEGGRPDRYSGPAVPYGVSKPDHQTGDPQA